MAVPAWVIAYTVLLLVGLIVGLLARLVVTIVVVVAIVVVLAVWLIGLVAWTAINQLPTLTGEFLAGFPIGPQVLFSVGGLVFLGGVALGLLATTRLRGFDRPRPV